MINEDKISPIVIDFKQMRESRIDESFLAAFGNQIKYILKRMFSSTGRFGGVRVKGTRSEIDAFTKAVTSEKKYIEAIKKYGLDDPRVVSNKSKLNSDFLISEIGSYVIDIVKLNP